MDFILSAVPIDVYALRHRMMAPEAGGFCSFEGWVRNHHQGRSVNALAYEAYAPLALKEGRRILREAQRRFAITSACAEHRIGHLIPGELAVWVGVSAAHRDAAFDACRFIIDAIKDTVPIWKHEFYSDGTQTWVDPTQTPSAT
ncbi:molybdenum cofactor biosynthesis protein MoaE [Ruficoccus amylovorans]|uniref:Molybdopterin synthase catalytic subunit n=1 Tax=Ruficoccus amylovorans TaxID=1804625 RepID=A0A842HGD7_9BACT|nr:molybdenum cofactor biosynthesis protein MoaE [Ruficoccus amylovorans]MBC2595482.1 molybdenum cofactor biosynthesis protein MoaE [Ruficoccus amylovorans]